MTATAAAAYAQHPCPKCGAKLYDNRQTKTNPKSPDFKCSNYKAGCDFVEWPPKATPPKPSAPKTQLPQARSYGTPDFLPTEGEEQAELQKKIGFDIGALQTELTRYAAIVNWYLDTVVPILTKSDIGASPESVTAGIATIFIQTSGKK